MESCSKTSITCYSALENSLKRPRNLYDVGTKGLNCPESFQTTPQEKSVLFGEFHPFLLAGIALERPHIDKPWGMTLSMLDRECLIVGCVDRKLMTQYTLFSRIDQPQNQNNRSIVELRAGDVIRYINGRPVASFPSFLSIIDYFKANRCLWLSIARNLKLPLGIALNQQPQRSCHAAEEAYHILKPLLKRLESKTNTSKLSYSVHIKGSSSFCSAAKPTILIPTLFTNPWFRDTSGKQLAYDDDLEFDPDEGRRAQLFIVPIGNVKEWLNIRKMTWRCRWKPHMLIDDDFGKDFQQSDEGYVSIDFWTSQGFSSFKSWKNARVTEWRRNYSWNKRKRRRIVEEANKVVHFPSPGDDIIQFFEWFKVRKNQWNILRRRKQRKAQQQMQNTFLDSMDMMAHVQDVQQVEKLNTSKKSLFWRPIRNDMLLIDSLLEEQDKKRKAKKLTFDLKFVFDATHGAPDDVIAHCLQYLHPSEHGKLLCISYETSNAIKLRDDMWRQLCPTHWVIPRRPRKQWCDFYLSKIRQDAETSRKLSDDLIAQIGASIFKGDHMQKVEKIVSSGEKKFSFDINYASGVVFERNTILNLAVINGRQKVARWLIETKSADIETCDRGGFTPLLNAAWAGNVKLVRFLLSKGSDRTAIGRSHYTKPLAPPDFPGYTAEEWARERGHIDIADLIQKGL
jgi:Ankyrin repeats (many copies)